MPGILLVYSDPGAVLEAEFNNWYDSEHVPLRVPIPAFQSWSRWVATDGQKPGYFALYDLTSTDAVNSPPYSTLAETRSDREKSIIPRLALLDRRTYERIETGFPPRAGAAYNAHKPGPFMIVVEVDVAPEHEEDFGRWYDEEHIAMLAKTPQWLRTTRYVLKESGASGTDDSMKPKGGRPPKYLALHEWSEAAATETEEFKAAGATPWSKKVVQNALAFEVRFFQLWKSWERE